MSASEDFCNTAEEVFESLSDTMQTVLLAMEEATLASNDYMRSVVESLHLLPVVADDAQSPEEEERCLRRAFRCGVMEMALGGSAAGWSLREDVAHVISHREGRYTVFARMFPRLSYGEVKRLRRDIKTFLPEGAQVRLIAVWEKRKKR